MDMVRCMLKKKNLSTKLWIEVASCVVYLINRSLTQGYRILLQMRHELNMTTSLKSVFLLDIVKEAKLTSFTI
ncbi:hypothetical protein ZIOFF_001754 [Zingiber officinale]|uniref:Uncharacterized protein n=1 Tax=Zingiber officinale TaxID=94328 RepID=A0A8J5I649_ZINOF|nr:hypothetical protein ZIOFF_001754 [Zingiber officinale]